jgi:hypothetical protein
VRVRLIGLGQCKIAAISMHMGLSEVLREQIPGFTELRPSDATSLSAGPVLAPHA